MTYLQTVFTDTQGFDKLAHLSWKNEGNNFAEFIVRFSILKRSIMIVPFSLISCSGITMPLWSCVRSHSVWNHGRVIASVTRKKNLSSKKNNILVVATHECIEGTENEYIILFFSCHWSTFNHRLIPPVECLHSTSVASLLSSTLFFPECCLPSLSCSLPFLSRLVRSSS